ncbi:hypothetical protein RHOFW104T7_08635 [Rhodanobacter thiooxydans]|uniref:Cohesin domain-containing protein n=1 Tax=Rhodanobacter thiooxydans TaxID=416169 RepID=A0A154QKA3_9GAMM|nr:DUF6689 family protein [Rhodanobacter thiooxydans]EIM00898.1 hypothetical protein UUA_05932 [Rhodanobacter thiooxydans LCS2]KZC24451.1 hypothetical protein RHOFW104T7_08635 [Rhodanobacter thiooxydans]MCW0203404.1 hypothetical protein [Rhodanobacter thiooxydans]
MPKSALAAKLVFGLALCLCAPLTLAQNLPVTVAVAGNVATVRVDLPTQQTLAEVILTFDDSLGLSPGSLGVSAQLVDLSSPALLARLPNAGLNQLDPSFPLMVTIEPPTLGGLSFQRTVRVEVHTHALTYAAGSQLRLFKAPLNGSFRDITDEIAPGSVRARGTTGGFSQFLVLTDLRSSSEVVASKFDRLQSLIAALPLSERGPLQMSADAAQSAFNQGQFGDALNSLDQLRARVASRAGTAIPSQWRATRDTDNQAGELLAATSTLAFSIGYQRDLGR